MTYELNDIILSLGKTAATEKMMLDKNLPKKDMRLFSYSDLQLLLDREVQELKDEILKLIKLNMTEKIPSAEILNAIRNEARDVIAFASGIVAKAFKEQQELANGQLSLWDE
jgi:hypothetical protein